MSCLAGITVDDDPVVLAVGAGFRGHQSIRQKTKEVSPMAVDAVIHSSQRTISPFLETTEPVAGLPR
jgi:hypothetical protein